MRFQNNILEGMKIAKLQLEAKKQLKEIRGQNKVFEETEEIKMCFCDRFRK